ncbi:MAG: NAD-dependent epimerase/dehydratase family protein, partial [Bacteroidaceae bacterium]
MRVSIIGSNGMLSVALAKYFYAKSDCIVDVYGLDYPNGYEFENFYQINLLETKLDYDNLLFSDVIIYASGAGVQAALSTDSSLMYALNVNIPIEITLQLKKRGYKGKYVSFGSYMEIGLNSEEGKAFTEDEVVCSELPITNDYGLSKRLYSRYMNELMADYSYLHFIL